MYQGEIGDQKSNWDNLCGFIYDLEVYIDDSQLFETVTVETKQKDPMVVASAVIKNDVSLTKATERIEKVWETNLRYTEFEKHQIIQSKHGVDFWFCTKSGDQLGVYGCIQIRKNAQQVDPVGTPLRGAPNR